MIVEIIVAVVVIIVIVMFIVGMMPKATPQNGSSYVGAVNSNGNLIAGNPGGKVVVVTKTKPSYYDTKVTTTPGSWYTLDSGIFPFYDSNPMTAYIMPSMNPGKTIDYNSLMAMDENQWAPQMIEYARNH